MKMVNSTSCTPGVRRKSPSSSSRNNQENSNPNFTSPVPRSSTSLSSVKSVGKFLKSELKSPNPILKKKIREREFVVRNNQKNQAFIRTNGGVVVEGDLEKGKENKPMNENIENPIGCEKYAEKIEFSGSDKLQQAVEKPIFGFLKDVEKIEFLGSDDIHCGTKIKPRRDLLMEEAMKNVPEPGSGRVKHLVKAFEKMLTISNESEKKKEDKTKKAIKWPLTGLSQPSRVSETPQSSSAFCSGELFFSAESLGIDFRVSSSFGSRRGSTSSLGRRRRSGSFFSGTAGARNLKRKQQQNRATSMRPFKLRTEERGRAKEEEFLKKLQEMMIQEEKQRIPIALGLPWTTDEPECLIKPLVKECTQPIDLKLHSDERAVERAEFDHQVKENMMLIEQYRLEIERQMKLEEEEEIRRLRNELFPKAQPMPYFDRPFVPRRSMKQPTIPKEPKFHIPGQ